MSKDCYATYDKSTDFIRLGNSKIKKVFGYAHNQCAIRSALYKDLRL